MECFREPSDTLDGFDMIVQVGGCWLFVKDTLAGASGLCAAACYLLSQLVIGCISQLTNMHALWQTHCWCQAHAHAHCGLPWQEDYPGAAVNSGVIACKAKHPVWQHAFDLMVERKGGCGRECGKTVVCC